MSEIEKIRTLFVSDTHLGTRGCQADKLLELLKHYDAETIFLVGDIIDGWRLRVQWFWPANHNLILQKLLRKVRKGTRIIYVPGNHDEFMRSYTGHDFGGIEIEEEFTYDLKDGRKLLVLHGDKFDSVVRNMKWLAYLGDWAYDLLLYLNRYVNIVRRKMKLPYWSFSAACKQKVKQAVNFISNFESCVAKYAVENKAEAVICGHIHHAQIAPMHGVTYMNCGDWVESCTAIVERLDGTLEIIHWPHENNA